MQKISTLAVAAVLLGGVLAGCGGSAGTGTPSNAQVTAALRTSATEFEPGEATTTEQEMEDRVQRFESLLGQLRQVAALQPLFAAFDVPNPVRTDDDEDALGLIELLRAVKITVSEGTVTLTNRATGGVIFTAPLADLASGTFDPANVPTTSPTAPPPTACTYGYSDWSACQGGLQTRAVVSATPAGCAGTPVLSQVCTTTTPPPPATCTSFTYSAWGACQPGGTQTRTVATSSPTGCTGGSPVTTQACTYTPPVTTCTSFTYSAWGACQPDGTQTRTVATSSPTGCTGGSPVTTQACTYTPPLDGAALYASYCSSCHGPLASSSLKGKGISVTLIHQMNMMQGLTDAQLQAIVTAVGP